MRTEIKKCDRCKKETEDLVDFQFVNRGITIDTDEPKDYSIFGYLSERARTQYPEVKGELCLDCVNEIGRWLGHPENILLKENA